MRPKGDFANFHKLISLVLNHPKPNQVALSRLGWPPFTIIPGQFAACDCNICRMCIEPINSLLIKDTQLYGGITNIQIPRFALTRTIYDRLADSGGILSDSYKPALSYCLKTQVMAAVKSIDHDLFASLMRSSYPIDYQNCLTGLALKAREAGRRGLSDGPGIKACGGSRSFVAFNKRPVKTDNLVRLPLALHSEAQAGVGHELSQCAARVIDFQEWIVTKETISANKDKMTRQKIRRMTMREKRLRILDLISDDDMDHQTLASILEFLESIAPDIESQS